MNFHAMRFRRRGSLTVEAALLFPLLMILTFGLIEYGWMFIKQQQITNTARQAARFSAMVDTTTQGQVTGQISTLMTNYGLNGSGYTYAVTNPNVARGSQVSVTVTVPYANIDITGFTLIPMPSTVSAKVTMEKEGM